MNLHEYQAKGLLRKFDLPLLNGIVAYTPREAQKACLTLGGGPCVVKAQVHAGGRGKAGGVKLVRHPLEARQAAQQILGMRLISPQTGPSGKIVRKVYLERGAPIQKEIYLSLLVDRARSGIAIVASAQGGVEIEEVASKAPENILTVLVKPESGLQDFHVRRLGFFLGFDAGQMKKFARLCQGLFRAFLTLDCSLLEINPLALTPDGDFILLDVKMSVDDNALYRQPEAFMLMDYDETDEREIAAGEIGINYIALEGNIGCMVNGAGLAMATMDAIQAAGGRPANFLDVGGGATKEQVAAAFRLILSDPSVKGILINIFGGIVRCDVIAEGVIAAARDLQVGVPIVVRLQGTNVDAGKKLLSASGLRLIPADDMGDAAAKVVQAVQG